MNPGWWKWWTRAVGPPHLESGRRGEDAARGHLQRLGWKFLAANFRGRRGELDLVFRDGECLVFVEVKARGSSSWTRPAAAVNLRKQRKVCATALEYLSAVGRPRVKFRFDIVEVVMEKGNVVEVRHLSNAFPLHPAFLYV